MRFYITKLYVVLAIIIICSCSKNEGPTNPNNIDLPNVTHFGKTYHSVLIGNQIWLKENLDVGTMIQGNQIQSNNGIVEKYCYNNDPQNCITYGGLYQWNEAMQYSTTPGARGICPPGFHIPTKEEFETLMITTKSNTELKAIGQGSGEGAGNNSSGFTALMSAIIFNGNSIFNLGQAAEFWSSTEYVFNPVVAYNFEFFDKTTNINIRKEYLKGNGMSIRCTKD